MGLFTFISISYCAQTTEDSVFIAEEMPIYPGCESESINEISICTENKITDFIRKNTIYPKKARQEHIHGRVILSFVVEKDGNVGDIKVIRGVHELLDQEAIRVLESLPQFTPGKQQGKEVRVKYNVPFFFRESEIKE